MNFNIKNFDTFYHTVNSSKMRRLRRKQLQSLSNLNQRSLTLIGEDSLKNQINDHLMSNTANATSNYCNIFYFKKIICLLYESKWSIKLNIKPDRPVLIVMKIFFIYLGRLSETSLLLEVT